MKPDFEKMNGLVPAVVQDVKTKQVLMLAYVNEEAYEKMLETGDTWFYSRSRNKLWHKGEESGHFQHIKGLYLDCDLDTIVIYVEQVGAACHTGSYSCFFNEVIPYDNSDFAHELYDLIEDRKVHPVEKSYTNYLLNEGIDKICKKVGEEVEVNVTFPEEYQAKELAGKEAIFKCAVKKIEAKELPELDDDFAKDVSEFDTLAEYKEHVKTNLEDKKANEAKRAKEDAAVDKVIENAQMDIPEAMLMTQCRQMLDDFSRRMQSQGLSMDQYFQFTGMTADKMMEDMKPQALKRIQTRLVLEKVAEVENIQPTEEEVNEEISKMAEAYKMEADKLKELLGERELEQMKKDMAVQKAVTVIADAAKEV